MVVSTLEGQCLDSLRNHAKPAQEVAVNPLSEDIRKCIAEELLLIYNKRLDEEQVGCRFASFTGTGILTLVHEGHDHELTHVFIIFSSILLGIKAGNE